MIAQLKQKISSPAIEFTDLFALDENVNPNVANANGATQSLSRKNSGTNLFTKMLESPTLVKSALSKKSALDVRSPLVQNFVQTNDDRFKTSRSRSRFQIHDDSGAEKHVLNFENDAHLNVVDLTLNHDSLYNSKTEQVTAERAPKDSNLEYVEETSVRQENAENNVNTSKNEDIFSKVRHNRLEYVKELLDSDDTIANSVDANGNSLLHICAQNNLKKMASLIYKYGGEVNAVNNKGMLPSDYCEKYGFDKLHAWFIQNS